MNKNILVLLNFMFTINYENLLKIVVLEMK